MSRQLDSLDRLLKIAAAQDPGAAAMAAAAQTAGSAPGAIPAPNMPPPAEEQGPSPDALQLQKEVAKRDKEINDLRAKVQDAKNQVALVEMKQQMSDEQNKMRDAMRKEYTQMQEKLRAQQKELDNRQSLFKQEEANHKAVMTANEAQHKSRLAEIANNHRATMQQQVADQKITLAQNEAKSLQEIANQQSQSRMQQADEYIAMTDKARKDADRVMQEKEKHFAAAHPSISPILQGRINDATSAISRLSKNNLTDGILYKAADVAGTVDKTVRVAGAPAITATSSVNRHKQRHPLSQYSQNTQRLSKADQMGELMAQAKQTYKPSDKVRYASMDELNRRDRRDRVFAGYDQQFGANSQNVAEADMGVARAENALARAKAEGNHERAGLLQQYIDWRKSQVAEKERLTRASMNAGSVEARADLADYKLQNKKDLLGKSTWWDWTGIMHKGQSDRDRAANRWKQEQEDKKNRESWANNRVTRFFSEPWYNFKQSINDANKSRQAANSYGAKTNWWDDADFDDELMKERYNQAVRSRGLTQSYLGTTGNLVMHGFDPVADIWALSAAAGAASTGVGAGASVGILAANAARKAAFRAARQGLLRTAKKYAGKRARNVVYGVGARAGIKRYYTGKWEFSLPGEGAGYADTRYGQYGTTGGAGGYDPSTGRYYDASGQSRDDSDPSMSYHDMTGRQQYYGY